MHGGLDKAWEDRYFLLLDRIEEGSPLHRHLNRNLPMLGIGDFYLGEPEPHASNRITNCLEFFDVIFFLNDAHPGLKAEYILANPPFNDSDWDGHLLAGDPRWQYSTPPTGNANFAWIQHIISHLSPNGTAGVVLSNGSLSSRTRHESRIRLKLVEELNVECIVALPDRLF